MIGLIDCRVRGRMNHWSSVPADQLEFLDRPLLQHAVEQMVHLGAVECVVIAENPAPHIERWGTGELWGRSFSVISPSAITEFLARSEDEVILVGRGDCIPVIRGGFEPVSASCPSRLVFNDRIIDGERKRYFTGWALSNPQELLSHCFATHGADGLLESPSSHSFSSRQTVSVCVHSHSPAAFIESQSLALEELAPELIFHARQIRPGVWVGRDVSLHSSVQINGRAFLGDNVRVGRNAVLNGHTVIARDSVVDAGAVLSDVSIQPGTYIGRNVQLSEMVVRPGAFIGAEGSSEARIIDPRILASSKMTIADSARALWSVLYGS